jgi:hypothetical protein
MADGRKNIFQTHLEALVRKLWAETTPGWEFDPEEEIRASRAFVPCAVGGPLPGIQPGHPPARRATSRTARPRGSRRRMAPAEATSAASGPACAHWSASLTLPRGGR